MPRRRNPAIELLETRRLLTVLTFDPVAANADALSINYGHRVTGASQDGFNYGTAGGPTPNVFVSYGPVFTCASQPRLKPLRVL